MAYKIQSGDTLSAIALANKTDVATLQKLNPSIKDPNKIYVGASLELPTATPPTGAVTTPPVTTPVDLTGSSSSGIVGTSDTVQRQKEQEAMDKLSAETAKQKELAGLQQQKEIEALKTELRPTTPTPTKPDYLKTYDELRTSGGVQSLEDDMIAIKDEKRVLQDSLAAEKEKLTGGISQGFYEGKLSEKQIEINDKLSALNRAEALAVDKLNLKNSYIDNIMKLTEKDYETASTEYNNEYAKNLQAQSLITSIKNKYESAEERAADNAKASLTTMVNSLKDNDVTWSTVSPEMKAQVNKMELQAGIPLGITEMALTYKPDVKILSQTTGTDASGKQFIRYQYANSDGTPGTFDIVYTGGVSAGTKDESNSALTTQYLQDNVGDDGKVSAATYQEAIKRYIARGGTVTDFNVSFPVESYLTPEEIKNLPSNLKPKTSGSGIDWSKFIDEAMATSTQ